jgi:hypothetical protein
MKRAFMAMSAIPKITENKDETQMLYLSCKNRALA